MNGKYLGVVIGAVVAIMLVGGVLMPVINDASTEKGTGPVEGAYGPSIVYNGDTTIPANTDVYVFMVIVNQNGTLDISSGLDESSMNSMTGVSRNTLPEKFIIWADNNEIIYLDGMTAYFVNNNVTCDLTTTGTIFVKMTKTGTTTYNYGTSITGQPELTYYYSMASSGDYSNFLGDNPPTMDTPTVSAAGMYIGPKIGEITVDSPSAPIYLAIPIVILVALLTAVAFVAFRKDY